TGEAHPQPGEAQWRRAAQPDLEGEPRRAPHRAEAGVHGEPPPAQDRHARGSYRTGGENAGVHTAEFDRRAPKADLYRDLAASLASLVEGETDALANLANASALLSEALDRINWAGFYLRRGEELVLGPFQGKPACVRIPLGRGVCGSAAARLETLVVPRARRSSCRSSPAGACAGCSTSTRRRRIGSTTRIARGWSCSCGRSFLGW